MEIKITGEPKEIAALVFALQERQEWRQEDKKKLERLLKAKFTPAENIGTGMNFQVYGLEPEPPEEK